MKLLTPLLALVVALGMFFGYVNPTYSDIQELQKEEARFDEALSRSNELIAVRDALLSRYNMMAGEDIDRLEKLLPDHIDNVRMILDLDGIAARYGLSLQNIGISEGQAQEGDSEAIGAGFAALGSIDFSFTVAAPYKTFIQFLEDLERALRVLDITSISFDPADDDLSQYSVTARIYWLK